MANHITDMSPRRAARFVGFWYLVVIVLGIFVGFFVRSSLVVPGDAAATANNIVASEGLFRIGVVAESGLFMTEAVLVVLFYVLLKPVSRTLALVAAFARLAMAVIQGINLLNQLIPLLLLSGAAYLTAFVPDQLHALVLLFLNVHTYGVLVGQLFFGLHTSVLGYLLFKSGYLPRIVGVLMVFASMGYLAESFGNFLFPTYKEVLAWVVAVTAVIGEFPLAFWLLLKGVQVQQPATGEAS